MLSFKSDGGTAAVAGNDFDVIGQGEDFRFDGVDQGFVIAAGQICPADRAAENGISGNENLFFAVVNKETAAAHGVSGKSQNFAAGQWSKSCCLRQIFCRGEVGKETVFGTTVHCRIGGGNFHLFDIQSFGDFTAGRNMVNVGVSEQNPRLFKGETPGGGDDFRTVGARVDDQQEFFIIKLDE